MAASAMSHASPFLHPGSVAQTNSLAVLHLRRDQLLPTLLKETSAEDTGYAEGSVETTRFGSYPHSTLIGQPWGSQIQASIVDTGSRGRKAGQKRKRTEEGDAGEDDEAAKKQKVAVTASSGFCHLLPPTPEAWTISLPHRTQVVYTPDYSFVIQKLRIRPGNVVIEAGAGSGSFTHAAARAAFSGYDEEQDQEQAKDTPEAPSRPRIRRRKGKVFSFEYHEPRAQQLQEELKTHGLDTVVHVTHRDVYSNGFNLPCAPPAASTTPSDTTPSPSTTPAISPLATAVFLDLPAPWLALPHLTRSAPSSLDPTQPVHICGFLPCIEQVTRFVAALRTHGWVEISMHELAARRLEVRRERIGLDLEGLRGVQAVAGSVEEALDRLKEVEARGREYRRITAAATGKSGDAVPADSEDADGEERYEGRQERLARIAKEAESRKTWKEGRLVHRTEPEIKTHTSYLVFGVLPREWTEEDESRAKAKWGSGKTIARNEKTAKGKKRGR